MSRGTIALALVIALFALAAAVIACSPRRVPEMRSRSELWHVYASTAAIVTAFLAPAALHPLFFTAVVAAGAYRCVLELALSHGARASLTLHYAAAAAAFAAVLLGSRSGPETTATLMAATGAAVLVAAIAPMASLPVRVRSIAAAAFPLAAAAQLARLIHLPDGFLWVFLAYACAEAHDSMASLFGRVFGRRPLLPRLSPRKTQEGAAAGAVFGIAVAAAVAGGILGQPAAVAVALAVLLTTAAFFGDLYTSIIKRAAGIKDFPPVHSLHGGILDIYDSTLATAIALGVAVWLIASG